MRQACGSAGDACNKRVSFRCGGITGLLRQVGSPEVFGARVGLFNNQRPSNSDSMTSARKTARGRYSGAFMLTRHMVRSEVSGRIGRPLSSEDVDRWSSAVYSHMGRKRWHTFPHSSQVWTLWPFVALLTRPVRVYLIEPASGGVADRCISLSREEPRIWGLLALNNVSTPDDDGTLLDSAGSEVDFAERGDWRRRFAAGVPVVDSGKEGDPGSSGASGCMLGTAW